MSQNYKEFNEIFQSHVYSPSYEKQLELAISICENLFSDYQDFYNETQWGNPGILLDAIKLCQLYNKQDIDETSLKNIISKVEKIIPDTESFVNASYALNASAAVFETLEFIIDRDQKHILNIGTYLIDTVDLKIQEVDNLTEQQIDNQPMMKD